jgi:MFS family permease
MTCLSLCVRDVVPASRFGGAMGVVMMVAWAGMAAGGYAGGVLFDLSLSYTTAFVVAAVAGVLNLAVLAALQLWRGTDGRSAEPDGYVGGSNLVR